MLSERSKGQKRPTWCMRAIVDLLRNELDKFELEGVLEKAMNYMSRNAPMFTRLQQIT